MNKEDEIIWKFLDKEVPYTNTKPWFEWQEECNRLGTEAHRIFLEALRHGPGHTHYAALLGLRMFNYEAWGDGHGESRIYKVRQPGSVDWQIIDPIHKPIVPNWDDVGGDGWINCIGRGKP